MIIHAKIKTGARKSQVIFSNEYNLYHIYTVSPPSKGKANEEIIKLVADYFGYPKSLVTIVKGHKATLKTIELNK